jgi:HEAT repeat protein
MLARFEINFTLLPIAIVLIVIGGVGVLLALLRDRSRGRRRCPKCWYDMTGTPGLTCPECGRTAKRERKLHRTRRRWRLAALALLITLAGRVTVYLEHLRNVGWVKAAPNLYYIARLPELDPNTSFRELKSRLERGRLRRWECRLLITRCIDILETQEGEPATLADIAELLGTIESDGSFAAEREPWRDPVLVSEVDAEGAIDALVGLLQQRNDRVRRAAIVALARFKDRAVAGIPALLGQLAADDPETRRFAAGALDVIMMDASHELKFPPRVFRSGWGTWPDPQVSRWTHFFAALRDCGRNTDQTLTVLMDGLQHQDPEVRSVAVWALGLVGDEDETIRNRIFDLSDDDDESVRWTVVRAASILPLTDHSEEVIRQALSDPGGIRWVALSVVECIGPSAATFEEDVRTILTEGKPSIVDEAARAWIAIGGDPSIAVDALLDAIRRPGVGGTAARQVSFLDALAATGAESSEARELIAPWLSADDPELRSSAAFAFVNCGGDADEATRAMIEAYWDGSRNGRRRLGQLARSQAISISLLVEILAIGDAQERALAAHLLGEAGTRAASELARLTDIAAGSNAMVADAAERAAKRVEYALEHNDRE